MSTIPDSHYESVIRRIGRTEEGLRGVKSWLAHNLTALNNLADHWRVDTPEFGYVSLEITLPRLESDDDAADGYDIHGRRVDAMRIARELPGTDRTGCGWVKASTPNRPGVLDWHIFSADGTFRIVIEAAEDPMSGEVVYRPLRFDETQKEIGNAGAVAED